MWGLGASTSVSRQEAAENGHECRHCSLPLSLSAAMCDIGGTVQQTYKADLCSPRPILTVVFIWSFFSQLTYRDWLRLELEIEPEVDCLSDTER